MSLPQAHAQLAQFLSTPMTADQVSAWSRLESVIAVAQTNTYQNQLLDSFGDLDEVLFDGTLAGRVKVMLRDMVVPADRIIRGQCHPAAVGRHGVTKCEIRLNNRIMDMDDKMDVWGTLIHEMLHAYLDLHTGICGIFRSHHGDAFRET